MQTEVKMVFTQDDFLSSGWREATASVEDHSYSSLWQAFSKVAADHKESGENAKAEILQLLSSACSMMIDAKSINNPFKPIFQNFQEGKRSAISDDFTSAQLAFFEIIIDDIDEPMLKGRLADLLWLCKKPRNPDHARIAIDTYVSHSIDENSWLLDIGDCWNRAVQLCLQIREYGKLEDIEKKLYSEFQIEFSKGSFMPLWLAKTLDRFNLAKENFGDIAQRLFLLAKNLQSQGDFHGARSYLELASKKYKQVKDDEGWLNSLVLISECFEQEGDQRASGASPSLMVANSFYENAIQAYRCIPVKYRSARDVENKLRSLRDKLSDSGKASLGEMGLIQSPGVDIKDMAEASRAHVSGKQTLQEALLYFTGLYSGPNYEALKQVAVESIGKHPLSSIVGATHISADGRVVAKTPAMCFSGEDDQANEAVVARQIQHNFSIDIHMTVVGLILPALRQIIMEHRVSSNFVEELCYSAPFVPQNREKLTAAALMLGFDYDFSNAIHLLCPQLEHMVRVRLQDVGAHTSNIDKDGVENENGLSTLLDLPEVNKLFGKDLTFEMKAIFTDAIGPNLRNEVAHGLLDDNSSGSVGSIYAWWMFLRLIVRSLVESK